MLLDFKRLAMKKTPESLGKIKKKKKTMGEKKNKFHIKY